MLQAAENRDGRAGLAGTRYLTPRERRARGKAPRQAVPRQDHGAWEPPEGRRDPVNGFATPERNVIFDINDLDERFPPYGNGTSSALAEGEPASYMADECGNVNYQNGVYEKHTIYSNLRDRGLSQLGNSKRPCPEFRCQSAADLLNSASNFRCRRARLNLYK